MRSNGKNNGEHRRAQGQPKDVGMAIFRFFLNFVYLCYNKITKFKE